MTAVETAHLHVEQAKRNLRRIEAEYRRRPVWAIKRRAIECTDLLAGAVRRLAEAEATQQAGADSRPTNPNLTETEPERK